MNFKCYPIIIALMSLLLGGCQIQEGIKPLEKTLVAKVKQDAPQIAHLEATYGIAFTNSYENRIASTDFYIRVDQAKIFYGYALEQAEIKIVQEGNQNVLSVRLPQPKQVARDRKIDFLTSTHTDYRPIDKDGNAIDVDVNGN